MNVPPLILMLLLPAKKELLVFIDRYQYERMERTRDFSIGQPVISVLYHPLRQRGKHSRNDIKLISSGWSCLGLYHWVFKKAVVGWR